MNRIVVWDPANEYWEGSLVDEARERILASRGGVCLPVVHELFKQSGVGGFHKRAWGAGYPLDHVVPRMSCPLTMWIDSKYRGVAWAARLLPDVRLVKKVAGGEHVFEGTLRLIGDSGQAAGSQHTSLTPDSQPADMRALGAPDKHGGWTIRGRSTLHPPVDGFYGFALYGTAYGLRVAWAAISLVAA